MPSQEKIKSVRYGKRNGHTGELILRSNVGTYGIARHVHEVLICSFKRKLGASDIESRVTELIVQIQSRDT